MNDLIILFGSINFDKKTTLILLLVMSCIFLSGFIVGKIASASKIKAARKDAVNRSRSVIGGQMTEQIAPYLPGFPCNPSDVRFLGKPCDFVGFCGLGEKNKIEKVVFVEVKTGNSALNEHEKQLRDCIENGKVEYKLYRI